MKKTLISNYRWFIVSLIFFITLVNFIDRSAISFVIEDLKKEFLFTNMQFGIVLSAFGIGYLLLTGIGGWLVDKYGTRLVWPIAATLWSLCMALFGFATGFLWFVLFRFLLGIAESPNFPAITRSISNWLPLSERARALALGLIAIPASAAIGAPITSYIVSDFGWRVMFFVFSIVGIIWSILWFLLFRDNPKDSSYVSEAEKNFIGSAPKSRKEKTNWSYVLTQPTLVANNLAYFAYGYIMFFATLWLPGYFLSQYGLNLKSIGWYLTIPWIVASIFLKLGGVASDWIYKKTKSLRYARSHLIWIAQLLAAISFICLSFTHSLNYSLLFLSLGLGFANFPQSIFFSTNIDVAKELAGSAQGLSSTSFALAGIVAPLLTGWLVDLTGNYQAAFLLLGLFTLFGVFVIIFFHKPDKSSR